MGVTKWTNSNMIGWPSSRDWSSRKSLLNMSTYFQLIVGLLHLNEIINDLYINLIYIYDNKKIIIKHRAIRCLVQGSPWCKVSILLTLQLVGSWFIHQSRHNISQLEIELPTCPFRFGIRCLSIVIWWFRVILDTSTITLNYTTMSLFSMRLFVTFVVWHLQGPWRIHVSRKLRFTTDSKLSFSNPNNVIIGQGLWHVMLWRKMSCSTNLNN